jgi:hypothetical protein
LTFKSLFAILGSLPKKGSFNSMTNPEVLNPQEELRKLSVSELRSRLDGLEYTKKITELQLQAVKRALAWKEGGIKDAVTETATHFCQGCEGWVTVKKEHILVGEPSQEKGMKARIVCSVCGDILEELKGSVPARIKYPDK